MVAASWGSSARPVGGQWSEGVTGGFTASQPLSMASSVKTQEGRGSREWPPALTWARSLLGLGPPSLHQGMTPAFPPGLGGSLPSAYQFVRDPQSGQLVVIPSDHLPHFGKWWSVVGGRGCEGLIQ